MPNSGHRSATRRNATAMRCVAEHSPARNTSSGDAFPNSEGPQQHEDTKEHCVLVTLWALGILLFFECIERGEALRCFLPNRILLVAQQSFQLGSRRQVILADLHQ